jgi:aspartate/methionine/tyrosine aminotransferase
MLYKDLDRKTQENLLTEIEKKLQTYKDLNLDLNMARGKPSPEQLDHVTTLFKNVSMDNFMSEEGIDVRNYGGLYGLIELRRVFGSMLKIEPESIWCLSSSSLTIEYDLLSRLMLFPLPGQSKAWRDLDEVKFLCPVPGYDRHFNMLDSFGIKMIPVPMNDEGPDMDVVEDLCKKDSSIKGIWTVPMYSNPTGQSYSEKTLRRLLSMEAAEDFKVLADMAYAVHHLHDDPAEQDPVYPLLDLAREEGHPDRVFVFASTSKMTYAGAGVACLATSEKNRTWLLPSLKSQMISADKVNMLKHARLFRSLGGVESLMKAHAKVLGPKFELVIKAFDEKLGPTGIATWTRPKGGYFVTIWVYPGTASKVYARCKELGLSITDAGACYPYGKDPEDSALRIAPSYPHMDELREAINLFCLVVREQALLKLLEESRS